MWGVWDAESCGGEMPMAIFPKRAQAERWVEELQAIPFNKGGINIDLCVLPVSVEGDVHNCWQGRLTHLTPGDRERIGNIDSDTGKRKDMP